MESGGAQKQTQAQKIAVRTHHAIKTQREAERVLPVTTRQQMASQKQQVDLPHNQKGLAFALKRKPIQKPYHLLTLKKRIHKKTNQISFIVQESSAVKVAYEHQELCDFISSQGTTLLPSSDAYTVDRDELLALVKEQLSARVQARTDKQAVEVREDLWELIKPSSYLKQYNLEPPKCDFFVNKVKHEEERQLASCSIGFDDPLPQPLANIPENIRDSPLYEAVSTFVQKRPCWLKNVLLVTLKQQGLEGSFGLNQLKNVLKHLCYTFRNGPWKHTFCAFGFDPRKNPKAVIYQNVSVKLKKKEVEDYEEQAGEQTYDPTFSDSPSGFIRGYQLGDLAIQSVQQLLRGKLISGGEECSKEHGWLSPSEHANVLRWMRQQRQSSR